MGDSLLTFSDADKRALRHAIKHFTAAGKGTTPRPKRRRGTGGGSGGGQTISRGTVTGGDIGAMAAGIPGDGGGTIEAGSAPTSGWKNYSGTIITEGSLVYLGKPGSDWEIMVALCPGV